MFWRPRCTQNSEIAGLINWWLRCPCVYILKTFLTHICVLPIVLHYWYLYWLKLYWNRFLCKKTKNRKRIFFVEIIHIICRLFVARIFHCLNRTACCGSEASIDGSVFFIPLKLMKFYSEKKFVFFPFFFSILVEFSLSCLKKAGE